MLDRGEPMPQYLRDHAVYYAGPAKTPEGYASGSFGPTTAGRMDAYVEQFQQAGEAAGMAIVWRCCQEQAMLELVGSELVKRAAERAKRREERLNALRQGQHEEGEAPSE